MENLKINYFRSFFYNLLTLTLIFFILSYSFAQNPIIIDHNCTDLSLIPIEWINNAKDELHIGYGHTSHGSQLTSGMNAIEKYFSNGLYDWNHDGGEGKLHLFEGDGYGDNYLDHDCGYNGWDQETRDYLNAFPDCNVIMWSWCGQVNDVDLESHYFGPMSQLELDFPNVMFVYMTGHLEGQGSKGSLFEANLKIRNYCTQNNKILFDFADIEKYDPDGNVNYQDYYSDDGCNYYPEGGTGNWAIEWVEENPDNQLSQIATNCNSCAHSHALNCVMKGIASWWLWARLVGWEGEITKLIKPINDNLILVYPNPTKNKVYVNNLEQGDRIIINNILNVKVLVKTIDKSRNNFIDISHFPSSIFSVSVIRKAKVEFSTLVIKE